MNIYINFYILIYTTMNNTQKKIQVMQALAEYFELDLSEYGGDITEDNYAEILGSYDFQSGASLGYGWPWLSLGEVVKALSRGNDYRD